MANRASSKQRRDSTVTYDGLTGADEECFLSGERRQRHLRPCAVY
jgi:hypothetical protein